MSLLLHWCFNTMWGGPRFFHLVGFILIDFLLLVWLSGGFGVTTVIKVNLSNHFLFLRLCVNLYFFFFLANLNYRKFKGQWQHNTTAFSDRNAWESWVCIGIFCLRCGETSGVNWVRSRASIPPPSPNHFFIHCVLSVFFPQCFSSLAFTHFLLCLCSVFSLWLQLTDRL